MFSFASATNPTVLAILFVRERHFESSLQELVALANQLDRQDSRTPVVAFAEQAWGHLAETDDEFDQMAIAAQQTAERIKQMGVFAWLADHPGMVRLLQGK